MFIRLTCAVLNQRTVPRKKKAWVYIRASHIITFDPFGIQDKDALNHGTEPQPVSGSRVVLSTGETIKVWEKPLEIFALCSLSQYYVSQSMHLYFIFEGVAKRVDCEGREEWLLLLVDGGDKTDFRRYAPILANVEPSYSSSSLRWMAIDEPLSSRGINPSGSYTAYSTICDGEFERDEENNIVYVVVYAK